VTSVTDSTKQLALKLVAQGRATVSEMARLANVSQQSMHSYARHAGLDPVAARQQYLEDLWRSEQTRPAVGRARGTELERRNAHFGHGEPR